MNQLNKKNIEDVAALTPLQEGMLFHYLKTPGSELYFEQLCMDISGDIDIKCFEQAWNFVIKTNEILRTVFTWENVKEPVQIILKEYNLKSRYYNFPVPGRESKEERKNIHEIITGDRAEKFDLSALPPFRVVLCKMEADKYKLIVSNHHILYDGWSSGIILKEFFRAYNHLVNGNKPRKPPVKTKFKEFVKWIQNRDVKKQEGYWRYYLKGFDTRGELPVKRKNRNEKAGMEHYAIEFTGEMKEGLEHRVKEYKITPAALFYSAWGILLQRYKNSRDVVSGTTVSGRTANIKGIEDMVGLFINTIPLRIQTKPGETVLDLTCRIKAALEEREEYESTPLVRIKEYSDLDHNQELFDTIMAVENYPLDKQLMHNNGNLTVQSYTMKETGNYDLSIVITVSGAVEINFIYGSDCFDKQMIENMAVSFETVVREFIKNPGKEVSQVEILSEKDKKQLLFDFNDTKRVFPIGKTPRQLFEEQVEKRDNRISLVFANRYLTYRDLNIRANRLAARLRSKGVNAGTIVGILAEKSIEMIVGMMGILKAGGAYLAINPGLPVNRIQYMLDDLDVNILLTRKNSRCPIRSGREAIDLEHTANTRLNEENPANINQPGDLAYLIYTSGSTGRPKGVLIRHAAITNLIFSMHKNYDKDFGPGDNCLSLTNVSFDVSVGEIFLPLVFGSRLVLMTDEKIFIAGEIAKTIVKKLINFTYIPPALLDEVYDILKNYRGKVVLNKLLVGVEPIKDAVVENYIKLNPAMKIINGYGPTETTIWSTMYRYHSHQPAGEKLPIGTPLCNTKVVLLDHRDQPVPREIPGHLYIAGAGIARGYLNNPQLTQEKFLLWSFIGEKKWYPTGDMARWLGNGNLEFIGRIDRQVKIRGVRIELGEIEAQLLNHDEIKKAVVIIHESAGGDPGNYGDRDKYLCAYLVTKQATNIEPGELRKYLSQYFPGYMIPAFFSQIDDIPLTPSGKVNRAALPRPKIKSGKDYIPPRNQIERKLAEIWWQILNNEGRPSSHLSIGIDENFFNIGGHSLTSVRMVGRIHKAFNIHLPLGQVFETPTIRGLAHYISKTKEVFYSPVEAVEKKEYYELSPVQKRLFVLQQKEPANPVYHITGMMTAQGKLHEDKFEDSLKKLITRHESLRTSFELLAGEPVQEIHRDVEFEIERLSVPGGAPLPHAGTIKRFVRPFDLSRAPLLRIGLIEMDKEEHTLVIDMHHIVSDGTSVALLIEELMTVYAGGPLPGLRIQYKDYAQWQKYEYRWAAEKIKKQEDFWLKTFQTGDEVPVLNLPTDYRRPQKQYFEGGMLNAQIGKEMTDSLKQLSSKTGTTLFTVLLASFYVFLSKLSGQEDIIAAAPVAGRTHNDLEGLIGMFVNTLVLRNYPHGQKTFFEFLTEVKDNFLAALENQDYPYDELVEKVVFNRALNRNPLFDVMLVLQNTESKELRIPGLKLKPYNYENNISKFDMTFTFLEKEDTLDLTISYSTILFKKETIGRYIKYFKTILGEIPAYTHKKLRQIEIIPGAEKERLLYDFNETEIPYPTGKTLRQLFEERAEKQLDNRAAVFGDKHITYGYLNERANRLARALQAKGVKPDVIVGLMVKRSLEMVLGMMSILKAGGAYLPLDPTYPGKRKKYMLQDSQSLLLLTDGQKEEIDRCLWDDMEILDIGQLQQNCPGGGNPRHINRSSDLAYVTYTSGSTGIPKGVMVEHGNAVNVVLWFGRAYHLGEDTRVLQMSEYTFDPSVNQVFATLLHGAVLHLISKENLFNMEFLRQYIEDHQVHVINFVPQFLNTLLDVDFKFKSIRRVLSGGEKLDNYIKNSIIEKGYELYNQYGPTETTIDALVEKCSNDRVTLGTPISNVNCYIVDKYSNFVPLGVHGELWIAGAGVARGYLNDPEQAKEKFVFNPCIPGSRMYRTGDLAKWLPAGKIEFLGRIDQQVKIRGFRIELAEIENQLLRIEEIREVVVIPVESGQSPGENAPDNTGNRFLCAYIVSNSPFDPLELKEYLSGELPDYMIPLHFVPLESLPLTPTGKIDRNALPEIEFEEAFVAPRDEVEETLALIWAEVLGIENKSIGIDANFFELGGHSLKATIVASHIEQAFDINVPLEKIFEKLTIRGFAGYIKESAKDKYISIEPVEKKEYYPLSSAQQRLYFLQRLDLQDSSYNISDVLVLEGNVDVVKMEETFRKLIKRHESMRTSIMVLESQLAQRIHEDVDFSMRYYDVRNLEENSTPRVEEMTNEFVKPFDLSRAPLLRLGLIKESEAKHTLMIDMHHITADGTSLGLFIQEFVSLYKGQELPGLKIQYKDYAQWQGIKKEQEEIKRQEEYWLKEFAGEIPVLNLPLDFERPAIQSSEGSTIYFEIGKEETDALKRLSLQEDVTLFMMLLSIFGLFLTKISGQEDIIVGTPIAGRRKEELHNVIGMFVNTLAMRSYPSSEKTFKEFLAEVKERAMKAYENQDYQFEDLVENLEVNRDTSRTPLFDVMFALQNMDIPVIEIPGFKLRPGEYQGKTSKFDLYLEGIEIKGKLIFTLVYRTKLFKEETIQRFIGYFKRIVPVIPDHPDKKISGIDILSDGEKDQLLYVFNTTAERYPRHKTIRRLFEEQVEQTPDHIAVIGAGAGTPGPGSTGGTSGLDPLPEPMTITYEELNKESNQLARTLRAKGAASDTITGIMTGPSLKMIVGILSILKAGGGYLPIDPRQPQKRIIYMLNDSQASLLLTSAGLTKTIPFKGQTVYIDDPLVYKGGTANLKEINTPADMLYTIYTSGTTGKSKGTLIENKNLVNYIYWFKKKIDLTGNDRTLLASSFSFDLGYTVIYSSILSGCQLHVIPGETYQSPENLIDYISRHQITYIKVTPSLFTTIVDGSRFSKETCRSLRLVLLGGEEIKLRDVEKSHAIGPHMEIMNHYGPTEATIGCVAQLIDFNTFDRYKKRPTIGYPIDNMKVSILDNQLKLVPVGVPGELCISGAGVARGYLNNPELTAEKFLPVSNRSHMSYMTYITYKTGDMARWEPGGAIEFLGRIDSQVKIRGYRIETGEIENRLLRHQEIKEAAVIHREHPSGDKYLCAYIVLEHAETPGKEVNLPGFGEYLADKLPDYMIPSYFVTLEQIPLTPNGKLNRKLLPVPGMGAAVTDYRAPGNQVEKKLAELWREILEVERIGIDYNFFQWGGHSLKAIILISRIHKIFHVNVTLAEIFSMPTIRGLSGCIKSKEQDLYASIEPAEQKDCHVLSSPQKRLYILHRMDENSTGYNMPSVLVLEGDVDKGKVRDIFLKLIRRHESLRTSFEMQGGEPVQKIHKNVAFEIEYDDAWQVEIKVDEERSWHLKGTRGLAPLLLEPAARGPRPAAGTIKNFIRPFDLSKAPLLRVGLVKLPHTPAALGGHPSQKGREDKYLLMVDMHHIISDGISRGILVKEFMALAAGQEPPVLRIRYKDFSEWRTGEKQKKAIAEQEIYWKRRFRDEIPVLDLPTDYARPTVQRFEGNGITFEIDQNETELLKSLALKKGTTLYMILLAVYYIFLSKLSNQEDILVGTPTVGRRHADLEQIIGMFVNTLVLRNYPNGEKTYTMFLEEVMEGSLEAFENQDYPYEELVEEVSITRDVSRNPLFDTMFVIQNIGLQIPEIEIFDLKLTPHEEENKTSKFDLTLIGVEAEEKLSLTFEYSTNLFEKVTIERFISYIKKIVSVVAANPDVKIRNVGILAEEEKHRVLYDFNATAQEYPKNKTIHEIFAKQVEKTPDQIGVIDPGYTNMISYKELNRRANRLAMVLRSRGVKADTVVGLLMERRLEMMISMLAIFKAGAGYLPIVPTLPAARRQYMIRDAAAPVVLSHKNLAKESDLGEKLIQVDQKSIYSSKDSSSNLNPAQTSNSRHTAYVIYTSGSTGKPKGVMIGHSQLTNFVFHMYNAYDGNVGPGDNCLCLTEISFDVSVCELIFPLMFGASLVLMAEEAKFKIDELVKIILEQKITFAYIPPALLPEVGSRLKENHLKLRLMLDKMLVGVEPIRDYVLEEYMGLNPGMRLLNGYGPTETTICTTMLKYRSREPENRIVPIGSPISNMQVVILDMWQNPIPVGIAGELCASGEGVGRGYLNNPELTADQFVRNPWFPGMRMYMTGDLARWLGDGTIEFIGRIDRQVKIRGYRIELGEIENQLLKVDSIGKARVIVRQDPEEEKYLCGYIVSNREVNITGLKMALSKHLSYYMIPSCIIRLDEMPLTPHGKLDIKMLPAPGRQSSEAYVAPRNRLEEKLIEIWCEILGRDALAANREPEQPTPPEHSLIGIDDNFFQLGGHSLKATVLATRVHKEFNVNLPLEKIFETPTIRCLAGYIKEARVKERFTSIEPVEAKDRYRLSAAQKRLFIVQRMNALTTGYNISSLVTPQGVVEKDRLEKMFKKLIARHESLRTSFEMVEEEPVQRIHKEVEFEIEYYDMKEVEVKVEVEENEGTGGLAPLPIEPAAALISSFIRPFDLSCAPLLRVGLLKERDQKYILMVDMHHIISDAISMEVFVKEFTALAAGQELPALRIRYIDFPGWQAGEKQKKAAAGQAIYWKRRFPDEIPVLDLPTDYTRPTVQRFEGNSITFEIDQNEVELLKSLALEKGTTLYMILLAVYYIFLSKLGNQEDILVGTPTAGRRHADLEPIIGMFVNTLVLRNYPNGEKTYTMFLKEVMEESLQAFENQDYPYEELVEEAPVTRDVSRNPLFDTMFVIQNTGLPIPAIEILDLKLTPYEYDNKTSKFDLTLIGMEAEEKLSLTFEYSTNLFKKATIERFIFYLKKIVSVVVANPDVNIRDVEILGEEEKRVILYDFNDTTAEYPQDRLIHELYVEQTARNPDSTAVIGPLLSARRTAPSYGNTTGDTRHCAFSYRKLNEISHQLAYFLKEKGVGPDTIVGIMMERSIEMVVGIMGILKAGGAYLPIDADYPGDRVRFMLTDSNVRILLRGGSESSEERERTGETGGIEEIEVIGIGNAHMPAPGYRHSFAKGSDGVTASVDSLAYVLYTSGSTGRPKGVPVRHGSVVNILLALFKKYPLLKEDTYLLKTTYTFDVSVSELFGWYLGGGRLAILEPGGEKDPLAILDWIERRGVTHINFVPSMFGVFLEILDPQKVSQLTQLKYIFLAGEALAPHLVTRFNQFDTGIILENIYGPTENTIYASQYSLLTWQGVGSIPIGKPLNNIRLSVLNPNHRLQPIGVWGELCIGGEGLARGYLNRPELTAEKFNHDLWDYPDDQDKRKKVPGRRYHWSYRSNKSYVLYKTGDLARWLPDGNLEFLGRIDHQVKIRGFRIEPGEIENQLLKHNEIREAVVLTGEDEQLDRYLCAYIVPARAPSSEALDVTGLRNDLLKFLPDYMIPSYFVKVDDIPLTPTGKIDRSALPAAEIGPGEKYTAPRDKLESRLADIWGEVLLLSVPIGIDDNFFQSGGHSLKALTLLSKIHQTFHVKLPLTEMFKRPTVRRLSQYIRDAVKEQYISIEAVEKKEYYPLSSAQKRLYFLQQMEEREIAYNMPSIWILAGDLNKARLEGTFRQLIQRHDSLRTSFEMAGEEPVQRIHDQVEFEIQYNDPEEVKVEEKEKKTDDGRQMTEDGKQETGNRPGTHYSSFIIHHSFIRPFDLSRPPLLRVGLIKIEEKKHILIVDMHHIVSDGMSIALLSQDFMSLYPGRELRKMRLRCKDYAEWQNREKESIRFLELSKYWQEKFAGEIPVLDLPTDYPRPTVQKFEGSSLPFEISREETNALKGLTIEEGATLYMVLLAIYTIFLFKISNQEDIIIGAPIAGRSHADLEKIIGMFVNTLALRHYPPGDKSFIEFLTEVKERTLQDFENREYQYEDLVEQVVINRDLGRNPLFDVSFLLHNVELPELAIPGLKLTPYPYETVTSKFDLTLECMEKEETLEFNFNYSTNLFKRDTIERFTKYFKNLVSGVAADRDKKVSQLIILSKQERERLVYDFNATASGYPDNKTIRELFEEQVEKTPHHIAVLDPGRHISLTYKAFNEKSKQLAWILKGKGVKPGIIVVVMAERSIELIAGIVAVLKAGGAYLPMDPNYPRERITYILQQSQANIILTQEKLIRQFETFTFDGEMLNLFNRCLYKGIENKNEPENIALPRDLAYVIYTSGSTGNPKGVMVEHRNVINFIHGMTEKIDFSPGGTILALTTISFDIFLLETLLPITIGLKVVMASEAEQQDPGLLEDVMARCNIDMLQVTPSRLKLLLDDGDHLGILRKIGTLMVGGEAFPQQLLENLKGKFPGKLYNMYGPTETTVWSAIKDLSNYGEKNIGSPIANTRVYIVNKYNDIQPRGIRGELLIGGDGVARGYLNNPGYTAEKFTTDPYTDAGRLYRTGDIARWLPHGEIDFLGRGDHQVKVRGYRIELEEIEEQLRKHTAVEEAVVIVREMEAHDKYLCAYLVTISGVSTAELREYLSRTLPDYMIPSYFVEIEKIPLTPNGKIHRSALPFPELNVHGEHIAPRNLIEEKLVKIWSDLLPIGKDIIGIDHNFFQLGGHSLKAMALVSKIHNELDTPVPLAQVFKTPTIRGLSKFIKETAEDKNISIEVGEEKEYYKVTPDQKRMFILNGLDSVNTTYNIPRAWKIEGPFNIRLFDHALRALIQRHDSLRTSFALKDSEPVQIIKKEVEPRIEYINAEAGDFQHAKENENIIHQFIQPFDLGKAPLFRVGLIKVGQNEHVFICDMHHIISDGISVNILLFDFIRLYAKESLPRLRIQYKDFTMWKNRMLRSGEMKRQEEYWLDQFKGEPPLLNIPTDYPRQAARSFKGDRVSTGMDRTVTNKIKEIGLETETTLFMVLLAAFNILLSRYTEQEDIIVGTPISGRNHTDLDNIVGMFINTLGMRNQPEGHKSFKSFLKELKTNALKAYDNQYYPFEELANKLSIPRDKGRNPLFDVLFVSENIDIDIPGLTIKGLQFAPYQFEHGIAHLDLVLYFTEANDEIDLILEYSTALFKSKTARKILDHYIEILEQIAANRERNLNSIVLSHDFSIARSAVLQEEEVDFSF